MLQELNEPDLGSTTAQQILRSLIVNVEYLNSVLRPHVQMGNIKFESLCHGLSSSVQEVSLRLIKLSEEDKDLRDQVLSARKQLLDCSSNLILNAKHPFKALDYFQTLIQACSNALTIVEMRSQRQMLSTAKPALDSLDLMEKSANYKSLFLNVQQFGSRLHSFLEMAAFRCADIKGGKEKCQIIARSDTIKKLLPLLIQSLRESLRHPMNSHTRSNKDYFFSIVRRCILGILDVIQKRDDGSDSINHNTTSSMQSSGITHEVGIFIKTMDSVLERLDMPDLEIRDFGPLHENLEWLVKFALAVAKVSKSKQESQIIRDSHAVIKEANSLKRCLAASGCSSGKNLTSPGRRLNARENLREVVETLEQTVNNALLKLIVQGFCVVHSPLDDLITAILSSGVSPPDRLPEDVDELVTAFDDRADLLFHIAHYTTFCTNDERKSLAILSSLHLLQELEKELVPAALKLYFNPEDHGARSHLKAIRCLWMQEVESLEENILEIVDSTAFCYVINEEAKIVAALVKKEQYSQDRAWLHGQGSRLIKMCQRAVDFAWKDVAAAAAAASIGHADTPLADDHPIVKVERSTWEVQGALRLVLSNVEDLNLHKTMIRRVQVLITCLGIMSQFLVARNDTTSATNFSGTGAVSGASTSKVRVLTSISRITIGQDLVVSTTSSPDKTTRRQHGSSAVKNRSDSIKGSGRKALSFRSVQRQHSLVIKRDPMEDLALVNESIARLVEQVNSSQPFNTRKMAGTDNTNSTRSYYAWADVANNVRMSGITTTTEASSSSSSAEAKQTGFDFTEIFNQLSALSQDISKKIVAEEEANKRMASLGSSVGKRVVLKGEMRMSPLMAKKLNAEVKVGSEEDGFRITHASSSSPSFSHRGGGGGGGDISLRQVAFKNNNRRPPPCTTNTDNTFTTRGSGVVGSPTPLNFEEVGVIADAKKTTPLFRDPAKGEEQQEENENVGV